MGKNVCRFNPGDPHWVYDEQILTTFEFYTILAFTQKFYTKKPSGSQDKAMYDLHLDHQKDVYSDAVHYLKYS